MCWTWSVIDATCPCRNCNILTSETRFLLHGPFFVHLVWYAECRKMIAAADRKIVSPKKSSSPRTGLGHSKSTHFVVTFRPRTETFHGHELNKLNHKATVKRIGLDAALHQVPALLLLNMPSFLIDMSTSSLEAICGLMWICGLFQCMHILHYSIILAYTYIIAQSCIHFLYIDLKYNCITFQQL